MSLVFCKVSTFCCYQKKSSSYQTPWVSTHLPSPESLHHRSIAAAWFPTFPWILGRSIFGHVVGWTITTLGTNISPSNMRSMVFALSRLGEISDLFCFVEGKHFFIMEQAGRFFVTGDAWKEEIPILFLPNAVFFHGSMNLYKCVDKMLI